MDITVFVRIEPEVIYRQSVGDNLMNIVLVHQI